MKKRKSNSTSNSDDVANKQAGETDRSQDPPGKVAVAAAAIEDKKTADVECSWTRPVEEQMWWGAEWYPTCDVGSMGEAYITALYSDVWDGYDDIWSFRTQPLLPP